FLLAAGRPVEIGFDDDVLFHLPSVFAADEGEVEVRQHVESERVGGTDRRAFLGPAPAGRTLDVDVLGRSRIEQVLSKLEEMKHGSPWRVGERASARG